MVLAKEVKHLLGLGSLGEGGVAAQIAEHDDNLASVAFEDLFIALRHDQFGQLRREKSLQPPDPAQFFDLLGYPRLQATVQFRNLISPLPQFAEQPRVLDCNDRLRRKVFDQRDLLVRNGRISRRNMM